MGDSNQDTFCFRLTLKFQIQEFLRVLLYRKQAISEAIWLGQPSQSPTSGSPGHRNTIHPKVSMFAVPKARDSVKRHFGQVPSGRVWELPHAQGQDRVSSCHAVCCYDSHERAVRTVSLTLRIVIGDQRGSDMRTSSSQAASSHLTQSPWKPVVNFPRQPGVHDAVSPYQSEKRLSKRRRAPRKATTLQPDKALPPLVNIQSSSLPWQPPPASAVLLSHPWLAVMLPPGSHGLGTSLVEEQECTCRELMVCIEADTRRSIAGALASCTPVPPSAALCGRRPQKSPPRGIAAPQGPSSYFPVYMSRADRAQSARSARRQRSAPHARPIPPTATEPDPTQLNDGPAALPPKWDFGLPGVGSDLPEPLALRDPADRRGPVPAASPGREPLRRPSLSHVGKRSTPSFYRPPSVRKRSLQRGGTQKVAGASNPTKSKHGPRAAKKESAQDENCPGRDKDQGVRFSPDVVVQQVTEDADQQTDGFTTPETVDITRLQLLTDTAETTKVSPCAHYCH